MFSEIHNLISVCTFVKKERKNDIFGTDLDRVQSKNTYTKHYNF